MRTAFTAGAGGSGALWIRQGVALQPGYTTPVIYRRDRDGRGAVRQGGPPAGERLRVSRIHVAGAAGTRRPDCSAVSRGIWEIPETADRADMDSGVIHWIQPVL